MTDPQTLMRKPWLAAEPQSIWDITGDYPYGGTFTNCLALVLPLHVTDGHLLFELLPPAAGFSSHISPDWITSARRLILVDAQNPTEAYFADEQDFLDDRS
ncbi:hypothetical protein [Nocardia xishanensis]|uniref:hypothetical protein n=1 Tax=Nocardia xishanensis TaxID=238964 RepID=UPI00082C406C|nr:hypothetical protein [Nocardia xishanensis]